MNSSPQSGGKQYRIATIVKVLDRHPWFLRMQAGVQAFAKHTGHDAFVMSAAKADEHLQEKLIEDVTAQGVDALCIVPVIPQALEMALMRAQAKGIVVISHEASNLRNIHYDLEAFDNRRYGIHLMDHLARGIGAAGEYAIFMGWLTSRTHEEWTKAAIEHQHQTYPNMNLVSKKIEDHEDHTIAYQKTLELLDAYPHLRGILTIGMTASMGVGAAIEAQKLKDKVTVLGTGLVSACRTYLRSGALKLLSFWDPADAGYVMNTLAVMALQKQAVTDGMNLGAPGYEQITLKNKVIYGAAWIDVTYDTMAKYTF